jgi:protein-tyrosine phosphatase
VTTGYRVLFVCTGNTCRSVIAAHVLRRELADAKLAGEVASAGLRVQAEGAAADPRAQDVLRRHGYQSEHQARQFDPAMLSNYDLVIGLDAAHVWVLRQAAADSPSAAPIRLLGSFDEAATAGWDVPDPFAGPPEEYERVLAQVRSAMPGVLAAVRAGLAVG